MDSLRSAERQARRVTVTALFETFHVGDQGLQIIGREIDGGHAAGSHFRRRMFEELSELLCRELSGDADESGACGRAHAGITMTCVTGLRLENGLAFCGERIG